MFGLDGLTMSDDTSDVAANHRRDTEPTISARPTTSTTAPIRSATAPLVSMTMTERQCGECATPLGQRYIVHLGRNWCGSCYAEQFLPRCPACTIPVEGRGVRSKDPSLSGKIYHRDCFVCGHTGCTALLLSPPSGSYAMVEGQGEHFVFRSTPYCAQHYHEQAGTLCLACHRGVEGAARVTESGVYHLSCLTCQFTPTMLGQRVGANRKCQIVRIPVAFHSHFR